jgi:hypothetical protein
MKTIIALAIIGYAIAAQGTPAATSLCMGNNDSATTCSACYNYNLGTTGAKQFSTTTCATAVANTVTDCLWYSGTITSTKALTDCGQCNSKTWMNVSSVSVGAPTIACSATASSTTTCTAAVASCDQSYCLQTATSTYASGCRQCAASYKGADTVTTIGYPTCTAAASAIPNCSTYGAIVNTNCYLCATGYAVNTAQTGCNAFTTDAACRLLSAGNTFCKECKNNYYFTTTVCTLGYNSTTATTTTTGANLMAVSAFLAALLVFFN